MYGLANEIIGMVITSGMDDGTAHPLLNKQPGCLFTAQQNIGHRKRDDIIFVNTNFVSVF